MLRKDGLILPDSMQGETRLNLHPLLIVGVTEDFRLGIYWPNEQLRQSIKNKLSTADLSAWKDAITVAVKQSLDKRLPTEFNVS